jgi:hypothetical protein
VGVGHCGFAIKQQLIPQRSSHLQGLLHQSIVIKATADGSLVPLGHGISNATGQGSGRRGAN